MKILYKIFFPLVAVCLVLAGCTGRGGAWREVDVCVYGGTAAGVMAAYTAAMKGKSVLLVEPGRHLGGMTSGGLGYTDIGNKYVVTGLARDFYRRLGSHYGKLEQWVFEPSVAERTLNGYVERAGVEVLYDYRLHGVQMRDGGIGSIELEHSPAPAQAANRTVRARMFIDCTYEGDLMARAGVTYTVGREANSVYGETYNGVQLMRGHQFWDPIDPYVEPGNPASGLIWGVGGDTLAPTGSGDRKVQAYNFRVCLTDDPDNMVPITRPDNYDPARYELMLRLHEVSPRRSVYDYFIWSRMPNRKTDINNGGGISTDMIGMNWEYPEASYERRAEIWKAHEDYTKGMFYFLGHDERVPEHFRREMLKWGYPKDEYTDNGHWTHQLYVREARRMVADVVMTEHHCTGREVVDDPVAWAAYTMDSHNCDRLVVDGVVKNEGNVEVGGFPPYPISYRAIVPRRGEARNLLVPVCLSASHIAYGSIRMEPVFMVLGQAAAVAACRAIDTGVAVQDVQAIDISRTMQADPLADGSTPEILVDNDDASRVTLTGRWRRDNDPHRSYGRDFLTARKGEGRLVARYMPEIVEAGEYEVYLYFPKPYPGDESGTMAVAWSDGREVWKEMIDKRSVLIEGQTQGEWIRLGRMRLGAGAGAYVEVSDEGTAAALTADAVLFLPVRGGR